MSKTQPNQRATGFNTHVALPGSGPLTPKQVNKGAAGLNTHVGNVAQSGTATRVQPNKGAAGLNVKTAGKVDNC